ncbi:MAG: hypothetical protein ACKVWV_20020 [Planctomycetota bacterium]
MSIPLVLAFLACVLPGRAYISPAKESIAWESDHESTLARAKEDKRVVFVAVNFDGERACDRLADKAYHDKSLVALASATLNLVASPSAHGSADAPCSRFPGTTCRQHQKIDIWTRGNVLKPDSSGAVIAPHHVFLDPEGKVVLSIPYEVSVSELAWCFVTAMRTVDPQAKVQMPAAASAPRRLILGGVFEPSSAGLVGPATRDEVLRLVKELKKETNRDGRTDSLHRILSSDEPEGIAYVVSELRAGHDRASLLHSIGALSPPSYWEVAAEFAVGAENEMRLESAVALEQLGAPASLKTVQNALFKEDHPEIKKEWIRALAAAGASDGKVRKELLKRATSEKDEILRLNTIVALGSLAPNEDVAAALSTTLKTGSANEKAAAACAMAISRDPQWLPSLVAEAEASTDAAVDEACAAAARALRQGGLLAIREVLKKVAKDVIERDRWFGISR